LRFSPARAWSPPKSQRGFRVAPASREDFLDIAAMRKVLEVSALKMSIALGGDDWVSEIRRVHKKFSRLSQKATISDAWETNHREFHFSLISKCGSPTLLNFWSQLHDRFLDLRFGRKADRHTTNAPGRCH
jgi:GntR family transcriptional regulator, carbon starvation induced regulator